MPVQWAQGWAVGVGTAGPGGTGAWRSVGEPQTLPGPGHGQHSMTPPRGKKGKRQDKVERKRDRKRGGREREKERIQLLKEKSKIER